MPTLELLTESQQKAFDSCPKLNTRQRTLYFALDDEVSEYINNMRNPINQVGFLIQLAYFRASGKFFGNYSFKKMDVKYACVLWDLDYEEVCSNLDQYSSRSRSTHKKYILEYCGWQKFTSKHHEKLCEELCLHAKQQVHPKSLLPIASRFLINNKIELPLYYVFAEIISEAYNRIEEELIAIVEKSLTKNQKAILNDLIWIEDKRRKSYKYSALSRLKQFSYSTKIKQIEESIKNYKLLKAFYEKFEPVYKSLDLSENATNYYSEWVSKSRLFQLKQFKNKSKAYLYLLAHLKHQYFKQTDLYVDTLLKLTNNGINAINKKLDKHTKTIIQEQKKMLNRLASSHNVSQQVFKEMLEVLNNEEKTDCAKNSEIRAMILNQLNEKCFDDQDVLKLTDKKLSTQDLKDKLLKNMGASLQRKLTPIICELDFTAFISNLNFLKEIREYVTSQGKSKKNSLIHKGRLFSKIFRAIKSGELSVYHSYRYLPIGEYFIKTSKWNTFSTSILASTGLAHLSSYNKVIASLNDRMRQKYAGINANYQDNKHLSFNKNGNFIVSTPRLKKTSNKNKLSSVLAQEGVIPIAQILEKVNHATNFVRHFKHHSLKKVVMKPSPETIFAGLLSKGCNHGTIKMANISKGINKSTLNNTINWFFSLENIQEANNAIIDYVNHLALPNIYKASKNHSHTSSDGQKFNVGVDSILANYSFKYFGQSQGISVYTFIDDRQVLFYDTILSPGEREAAFVIDGLMANNVVNSHIHSTDTHGYSEVIFAVMHFLGVSFAPRIKKVGVQRLYCIDSKRVYTKKDYKIKPDQKINLKLIEDNWDDILRLIATIKTRTVTASRIFKRLNSYTKESPLYKALKEFGRIIKTIYILSYVDDKLLRQQIEKQLNKIELSNKFAKAVFFANSQEFRVGSTAEQKIIVACKSFIQNCIVLWNYLYLSQVLVNQNEEKRRSLIQIIKEGSVISWRHVNLHGEYDFTAANDATSDIMFELEKIRRLKIQ